MRRSPPRRDVRRYYSPRDYNLNPIWVLIGLNLILLIITLISSDAILRLGLNPDVFWSRPWTIITAMFTHADFWHFFGNMIVLFFFGRFLIMLVGQNWFLLVYFVGGIVGNILFLVLGNGIAVGASGAIYAIAGVLVVLVPNLRVYLYFILPMPLWVVVIIFFGLWSIPGLFPNIAWQAHLGGLVIGLIAGYYFRRKRLAIY
jgi:membrane associated rhomboid family serine protease